MTSLIHDSNLSVHIIYFIKLLVCKARVRFLLLCVADSIVCGEANFKQSSGGRKAAFSSTEALRGFSEGRGSTRRSECRCCKKMQVCCLMDLFHLHSSDVADYHDRRLMRTSAEERGKTYFNLLPPSPHQVPSLCGLLSGDCY